MADYYNYRRAVTAQKRRRRAVLALVAVLAVLCAISGYFWFSKSEPVQADHEEFATAVPVEATASPEQALTATAEAATSETAEQPYMPQRLLPAVDNAQWDHSGAVEQTIDLEYLNTDHRMVAVPTQGRVSHSYFDTVTFAGDSIASGLGIYDTGYKNAKYATYTGASVQVFVNNTSVTNAVTKVQETPMETIVASQPDYVYILLGTNNLVNQGGEESFIAYYERLIQQLRERLNPGVIIYLQAIPGVQENVIQTRPGLDNARIAVVNDLLANMALRTGCYFVNIREALSNPDGTMRDEYDANYDGIHFNPEGYRAWANYLATHTVWNRRSVYEGENPLYILGS